MPSLEAMGGFLQAGGEGLRQNLCETIEITSYFLNAGTPTAGSRQLPDRMIHMARTRPSGLIPNEMPFG
jgi:hypothetical protein